MIKNILKIASLLVLGFSLVACGDICDEEVAVVTTPPIIEVELTPVVTQPPVFEPVTPPETIFCPLGTATMGCPPFPAPLPIRVIAPTPYPVKPCVRNSNPLVLIEGVLTDNCDNKNVQQPPVGQ